MAGLCEGGNEPPGSLKANDDARPERPKTSTHEQGVELVADILQEDRRATCEELSEATGILPDSVPEERSPLPGDKIFQHLSTDFSSAGDAAEQEEGNRRNWRNQRVPPDPGHVRKLRTHLVRGKARGDETRASVGTVARYGARGMKIKGTARSGESRGSIWKRIPLEVQCNHQLRMDVCAVFHQCAWDEEAHRLEGADKVEETLCGEGDFCFETVVGACGQLFFRFREPPYNTLPCRLARKKRRHPFSIDD
ncbi:hypothetical protein ANN_18133 [Periplaneta americana]|uniref:Uncharacterized protein n=1 Tax=Periplaneta americana TaxID=6978 RepID=A0ABQ8SPD0_PERAM|nr:hypothetical protein ANN_18133 [Periplaneta americana]